MIVVSYVTEISCFMCHTHADCLNMDGIIFLAMAEESAGKRIPFLFLQVRKMSRVCVCVCVLACF